MALTWLAPDRSLLSVALVSHRKWRLLETPPSSPASTISSRNRLVPAPRRRHHQSAGRPPRHRTRDPPAAPGRGSLRCHARLPIGTLTQPRRSHASAKTTLPRNLAGTRQLIRAITIPAIGASLLCHLERCAARASPLPLHSDLDAPAARQYGRIEYGGLPVVIAIPAVVQRVSTTSTDAAPPSRLVYLFGSGR